MNPTEALDRLHRDGWSIGETGTGRSWLVCGGALSQGTDPQAAAEAIIRVLGSIWVYLDEREAEVRTLTEPAIRETLAELGIRLVNYADYRAAEAPTCQP